MDLNLPQVLISRAAVHRDVAIHIGVRFCIKNEIIFYTTTIYKTTI